MIIPRLTEFQYYYIFYTELSIRIRLFTTLLYHFVFIIYQQNGINYFCREMIAS